MYFIVLFSNTQKPKLNPAEGNTLFWDFKTITKMNMEKNRFVSS